MTSKKINEVPSPALKYRNPIFRCKFYSDIVGVRMATKFDVEEVLYSSFPFECSLDLYEEFLSTGDVCQFLDEWDLSKFKKDAVASITSSQICGYNSGVVSSRLLSEVSKTIVSKELCIFEGGIISVDGVSFVLSIKKLSEFVLKKTGGI